jgi:DNA repair protein RadC
LQQRESLTKTNVLAGELLDKFGSLHGVLQASAQQVQSVKGMGPKRFAKLKAMQEMHTRVLFEPVACSDKLTSFAQVQAFLRARLQFHCHECFAVIMLDNQHQFLHFAEVFQGTINMAPVYPRVLVKLALEYNAAAIILAHNHPSGNAEPSDADRRITQVIQEALQLIDVRVLDHVVVGAGQCTSFVARGWL